MATPRPMIHPQIHLNNYNSNHSYMYTKSSSLRLSPSFYNSRGRELAFMNISYYNSVVRNNNKIVLCKKSESESNKVSKKTDRKGHKRGKTRRWQPIIQPREITVLLLQLGVVMFSMRLLRLSIPLPGSDHKAVSNFVRVPYSEFLSKVSSDQVQKVEVDGVHIMFKLRKEYGGVDSEVSDGGNGIGKMQDSELLVRNVVPTKRVVYTTTRPSDIKTPYEKMVENGVEFGSPDKRSGGFLNSALVSCFVG